ncbi:hypothetical protein SDC9_189376 [bioreactor metagenome]|uniref:Uncharacterized protein n=1 Tax=bioreactor metagenome TaxID=1076179 RepID=A0A645HS00_9ZZZZ
MQRAAVFALGQDRAGDFKLFKRHVAERFDAGIHPGQFLGRRFAILAADVVFGIDQCVFDHRISHHQFEPGRKRYGFEHFHRAKVGKNQRIFASVK